MSRIIVTTQAELDATLAKRRSHRVIIEAALALPLVIGPTGDHEVVLSGGTVQEVWPGGTVQRVSGGTVQEVWSGGTVQRVSGGTVQEVWSGGTVQEVLSGGTVQRVSGGTVQGVWSGGTVQRVLSGGTVQEVLSGGTVQRVLSGGTVQRMLGASVVVRAEGGARLLRTSPLTTVYAYGPLDAGDAHVIDLSKLDESDRETWIELYGVEVEDGEAILYKAVSDDLKSGRGFAYPIGESVEAPDWADTNACGGGLHVSPTPRMAQSHFPGATRALEVRTPVEWLRPVTVGGGEPRAKIRTGRVVAEVDVNGDRIEASA